MTYLVELAALCLVAILAFAVTASRNRRASKSLEQKVEAMRTLSPKAKLAVDEAEDSDSPERRDPALSVVDLFIMTSNARLMMEIGEDLVAEGELSDEDRAAMMLMRKIYRRMLDCMWGAAFEAAARPFTGGRLVVYSRGVAWAYSDELSLVVNLSEFRDPKVGERLEARL